MILVTKNVLFFSTCLLFGLFPSFLSLLSFCFVLFRFFSNLNFEIKMFVDFTLCYRFFLFIVYFMTLAMSTVHQNKNSVIVVVWFLALWCFCQVLHLIFSVVYIVLFLCECVHQLYLSFFEFFLISSHHHFVQLYFFVGCAK